MKKLKSFTIPLIISLIVCCMCMGCGDDTVDYPKVDASVSQLDVVPLEPGLMPIQYDPVQTCYEAIEWLCNKMLACEESQEDVDEFRKVIEDMWNCPSIVGIRDSVEFYTICQLAVRDMPCADFENGYTPLSCQYQLE